MVRKKHFPTLNNAINCRFNIISFIVYLNYIFETDSCFLFVFSFLKMLCGRSGCWVHFLKTHFYYSYDFSSTSSCPLQFLYNPHPFPSIFSHQVFLFLRGLTNQPRRTKKKNSLSHTFYFLSSSLSNIIVPFYPKLFKVKTFITTHICFLFVKF